MVKKNSFIILIFCLALLFSLLKLSKGYMFEWDQADDASKVFSIISQNKPILIGPRVSNDNGFFVGPYHYYFLLPFFLLTKGNPIAGSYAVVFVNVVTVLFSFILIKKIFNQKIALISSIIISVCLGKICWNVMYLSLISIVAFYICYQAINKKFSFPLAMLFAGFITNIHLVPAVLVPIIIISFFLSPQKPKIKEILLGIFLFCLPFIPLIIFDIRHDFLNLNKLLLMIFGNKESVSNTDYSQYLFLRSFWRSLNLFNFLPVIVERLLSLFILIITPFLIKGQKNKILVSLWILFPILVLSQYHGAISEYYYGTTTSLIPLFIALILSQKIKSNHFITLIIVIFSLFSIYKVTSLPPMLVTLNDKKVVVDYLINQKQDQPFNLSYETGLGLDFGFNYLFEYQNKTPQNVNNAHLYTLFTDNTLPNNTKVVFERSIYKLVRR